MTRRQSSTPFSSIIPSPVAWIPSPSPAPLLPSKLQSLVPPLPHLVLASVSTSSSRLATTAAYLLSSAAHIGPAGGGPPQFSQHPLSSLPVRVLAALPVHFHAYLPHPVTTVCAFAAPHLAHLALSAGNTLKATPLVPTTVSGAAEAACLLLAQSLHVMATSLPSTATRDRGAALLDGGIHGVGSRSTGSAKADELRHQVLFLEHQCRLLYGIGPGGELHPFASPSELTKLAKSVNESVSVVTHLFLWADRNDPVAVDTFLELNAFTTLLHPLGPPPPAGLVSTSAWPTLANLPVHVAHTLSQCVLDAVSAIFTNVTGHPTLYYLLAHFANLALEADYGLYPPPVLPSSLALVSKTPPQAIPAAPNGTSTHRASWSQSASPVLVPLLSFTSAGARSLVDAVASAPALVAGRMTPPRSPLTSVMASLPWSSGLGGGHPSGTHSAASSPGRTSHQHPLHASPARSLNSTPVRHTAALVHPGTHMHTRSSSSSLSTSSVSSMAAAEDIDRAELAAHFAALVRAIANRGVTDPDTLHTLFAPHSATSSTRASGASSTESSSLASPLVGRPRSAFPLLTHSLTALAICTDPMSRAALTSVTIAVARTACCIPLLAQWMVANVTRQIADVAISALTSSASGHGAAADLDDHDWVWPWLDDVIAESPPDLAACLSGHLLVRYVVPMVARLREWHQLVDEVLAEVRAVPLVAMLAHVLLATGDAGAGRLAGALDGPHAWYDDQLAVYDRAPAGGVSNPGASLRVEASGPMCELNPHRLRLLADIAGASGEDEQLGAMRALLALLRHASVPTHVWTGKGSAVLSSAANAAESVESTAAASGNTGKVGIGWGPAPVMRRMWLVAQATGGSTEDTPEMDPSSVLLLVARVLAKTDNAQVWATGVSLVLELACVRVPGSSGWWEPIGVPSVDAIALLAVTQVEGLVASIGGHGTPGVGGLVGSVPLIPHASASRPMHPKNGIKMAACSPGDRLAGWLAIWHSTVRPLATPPPPLVPRSHAIGPASTPPPPPTSGSPPPVDPPRSTSNAKGDSSIRRHRSALSFSAARGMAPGAIMIAPGGPPGSDHHHQHPLSHSLPNSPPPIPMLMATSPTKSTTNATVTVAAPSPSALIHSRTSTAKSASSQHHRRTGSWAGPVSPTLPPGTPVKSPYMMANPHSSHLSGNSGSSGHRSANGNRGGASDLKAGVRDCLAQARELGISSMISGGNGLGKTVGLVGVDE